MPVKIQPKPPAVERWRSRIVGEVDMAPADLTANPLNPRRHPESQKAALNGALNELGWLQRVVWNRTTRRILDGHARVELAAERGETSVPVVVVELSEAEERLALASFDAIGSMATHDQATLEALLGSVVTSDDGLQAMLDEMARANGIGAGGAVGEDRSSDVVHAVRANECPECGYRWSD